MTHLNAEYAHRPREKRENPLGLFIAVIKEKPNAPETAHRRAFQQMILSEGYEDFLKAVVDEWQRIKYSTALRAAVPPTVRDIKAQAAKRKQEREHEDTAVEKAKRLVGERLFNLVMPNGKPLNECTGAECVKFGGFYTKIGNKVGPRRVVGKVLTANDLTSLLSARA